jgi:hypothetical protein
MRSVTTLLLNGIQSLRTMKIFFTRPRVYLIDFEVAIQFPAERPESERVSIGRPLGGSFSMDTEKNMLAPGIAYKYCSPFKLDVWQLGISFSNFKARALFFLYLLFSCMTPPFSEHHSTTSWRV